MFPRCGWMSGRCGSWASNALHDFTSSPHSDAYLAKVDPTGKPDLGWLSNGAKGLSGALLSLPAAMWPCRPRRMGWASRGDRPDGALWDVLRPMTSAVRSPITGTDSRSLARGNGLRWNRDYGDM